MVWFDRTMDTDRPIGSRGLLVVALAVVVLVLVLLGLAARTAPESAIYEVPQFDQRTPSASATQPPAEGQPPQQNENPLEGLEDTEPNPILQFISQLVVALLVVGGIGLVTVIVFLLVRTLSRRSAAEGIEDESGEVVVDVVAVQEHLARSSAELDVDGDVNQAIVRCWEGLEHLVEDAGAVRDPAQTAREFTRSVLQTADLPSEVVDRLADLYEAALFSGEQLPEGSRADAVRCLEQLRAALTDEVVHG